jgi:hypothetical protein
VGFFDCRCLLTGVSLKGARAAAVLLEKSGGTYHPIALALHGSYDRLGAIDGVTRDAHSDLVLSFFLGKEKAGTFAIDRDYWSEDRHPITCVDDLLWGFERNTNDNPKTALLDGQPIVTALICAAVWRAIAADAPERGGGALFAGLFGGVAAAEEMYGASVEALSTQIAELSAVSTFMRRRRIDWTPTEAGGQDGAAEMRKYLAEALVRFAGEDAVLAGLQRYEREVGELLVDDE